MERRTASVGSQPKVVAQELFGAARKSMSPSKLNQSKLFDDQSLYVVSERNEGDGAAFNSSITSQDQMQSAGSSRMPFFKKKGGVCAAKLSLSGAQKLEQYQTGRIRSDPFLEIQENES